MRHHHNLKIAVSGQHRLIWGMIIYFHRSETTSGSEYNFAHVHTGPLAANKCAGVDHVATGRCEVVSCEVHLS